MHTPLLLDYPAEHGYSKIRSFYIDSNLYISLEDIVLTLARTNSAINENQKTGLGALLKAQLEILDKDECRQFSTGLETDSRTETFITEPGLYRIISRDSTPASKKFQRWMFHEVLPSIRKHGTYPPPPQNNSDIMSLAQALAQQTSLLVQEIGEREKLANETKLRFEKTEQKIREIDRKIAHISSEDIWQELIEVDEYCTKENTNIDRNILRAMCAKLCLEQNLPFKKQQNTTTPLNHLYPRSVIAEAEKIIRK
ncbi:BRO family protein [Pseudomonas sp. JV241A]|uniref:BRO-N domain-containing protein n=1 Tax=Pseudomonas sp. JV241A TaxID=2078785 RepID=UPI00100C85DD|nr:BRO family protein [Pseudomonas sp. JV241A]SPO65572.1 conserved protein of unknown function [Pseudomonas sp. JV241A]